MATFVLLLCANFAANRQGVPCPTRVLFCLFECCAHNAASASHLEGGTRWELCAVSDGSVFDRSLRHHGFHSFESSTERNYPVTYGVLLCARGKPYKEDRSREEEMAIPLATTMLFAP